MRRDAFNIVSREWDDPWQQNRVLLNGACWDMWETCQRTPAPQGRQIQSKTRKTWVDSRWGRHSQVIETTTDEMTMSRDIGDVSIVLPSYCRPSPISPKACRTKKVSKNHHMTINTWIQHHQSLHVNLFSRRDLLLKPESNTLFWI